MSGNGSVPFERRRSNVDRSRSATNSWTTVSVMASTGNLPKRGKMCFVRWPSIVATCPGLPSLHGLWCCRHRSTRCCHVLIVVGPPLARDGQPCSPRWPLISREGGLELRRRRGGRRSGTRQESRRESRSAGSGAGGAALCACHFARILLPLASCVSSARPSASMKIGRAHV